MKVLGVLLGHDASACLVEDGKVVRYAAEERFNRLKVGVNNAHESVNYCLDGKPIESVDRVAIGSGLASTVLTQFETLLQRSKVDGIPSYLEKYCHTAKNLSIVDHHVCHAASAYYTSGFEKSLVVVIDGIGEKTTHSVYLAEGKEIKPLHIVATDQILTRRNTSDTFTEQKFNKKKIESLGWFYGAITSALGWRMCCDEGKTMGLAPYGDPSVIPMNLMKERMYEFGTIYYYSNSGIVHYELQSSGYYKALADKYGRENLAASAQKLLEDEAIAFIRPWIESTGAKNLCVAGGVFLNVKLNQKIRETFDLDGFWPFPLAGDSGGSVGAALSEYWRKEKGPYKPHRIEHVYWGPEYSNEEIKRVLDLAKLRYTQYDVGYVAGKLAENKIIGWFQGRMEGGPRALGGRSILMSPIDPGAKDKINREVKFREGFRPFCPSVTYEDAWRYFDGGGDFMIEACNVLGDNIPAVTHVDRTARPQFVKKEVNPKFHALIEAFGQKTGHPVLLNTSLNTMGLPICLKPTDAIQCFYSGGLDLMVLGDYVIEKGNQ